MNKIKTNEFLELVWIKITEVAIQNGESYIIWQKEHKAPEFLCCWLHCQQAAYTMFCKTFSFFDNQFSYQQYSNNDSFSYSFQIYKVFFFFFVGLMKNTLKKTKPVEMWCIICMSKLGTQSETSSINFRI